MPRLWLVEEGESLSAPDQGLVAATLVGQCKVTSARSLTKVGAQVQGGRHGWVGDNGCSMAVGCDGDKAGRSIQDVYLNFVLEPVKREHQL